MAFSHGPYTFDAQADGDAAAFSWTDQSGTTTTLANANTAGRWCHDTDSTTSSNVGPDHGEGGDPDGYAYTEMSSQTSGDIFYCQFGTALDASANAIVFDYYWCARGDAVEMTIEVETNEGGAGWVSRDIDGFGYTTIPGTSGATEWNNVTVDLTGVVSNASTLIRIKVTCTANPTTNMWHNDVGIDTISITGTDLDVTPVITDAGDEDYVLGETNIVVTGTDFIATQGTGDLELGDSATYGSATLVSQSIDSWSDTSIQFDLTIGTLDQEQLWLYVINSDDNVSNAWEVHVEMTPTITNAGDEVFETTETNIVMTGTNFLSTQSTGKIELVNNSVYASGTKVTQSIDTWADTSIQFDLAIGSFTEVDLWLFATNSLGHVSTGYPVQIIRTPTITNVEDEEIANNEQNVVLDGTYLLSSQGTGKLELADGSTYATATKVTQNIDTWGNTEIVFDVVKGGFSEGNYYLFVTNNFGEVSAGYAITLTAPPPETLYKTSNLQFSITSIGINTTVFMLKDE